MDLSSHYVHAVAGTVVAIDLHQTTYDNEESGQQTRPVLKVTLLGQPPIRISYDLARHLYEIADAARMGAAVAVDPDLLGKRRDAQT